MPSRRHFLAVGLAGLACPGATWADAGAPSHITAARDPDGGYALYGLRPDGALAFRVPLPARGHAAAAHPVAPEAVAFARRPGRFALVLDCLTGGVRYHLDAPEGRHFYGHGAFSQDGNLLFTTENDIASGQGCIGVWARDLGYARIDELPSHGIGPHEILRLPGQNILAVANGGIRTHPDAGREKLNLATMRANLTLISEAGRIVQQVEVPPEMHLHSLRHIAARDDGQVACAFQWQGDSYDAPPLLAVSDGSDLRWADMAPELMPQLKGYAGSVAWLQSGAHIALTAPRGGQIRFFDAAGASLGYAGSHDICGVAAAMDGGIATNGAGEVFRVSASAAEPRNRPVLQPLARHGFACDNHLVALPKSDGLT